MDMGEKSVEEITKEDFMKRFASETHAKRYNLDGSVSFIFCNCIIMRFVSDAGVETYFKQEVIQ